MPIVTHRLQSKLLENNPLGDSSERELAIYLPPGYGEQPGRQYPALLALVGFSGSGVMLFNRDPLGESLSHKLDRLIQTKQCPPVIVAAPNCFTRFGGNQYINSTATGPYENYLINEVIPFVNRSYHIKRWGVFGKSSGGYGSIVLGMRHPDIFSVLADHSGDANFELCYIPDFSEALDAFREAGGPVNWLENFWNDENKRRKQWQKPLNVFAMAAHYSPNPSSPHLGTDFPFHLETGEFLPEVWQRWREWDPVHMISVYVENLRKLQLIYIDCGTKDEFSLIWGARSLVAKLKQYQISHHYEEFKDGHMNIGYRYDTSLPLLVNALETL